MSKSRLGATAHPRASAGTLARIGAGFALLGVLYYWHLIDLRSLDALLARPDLLALAIGASAATVPLEALRWHVLLRSQGLTLRFRATLRIFAASMFFANFLPGAAGGDLVRGLYIYRAAEGQRTPALLSILVDRLIGLVIYLLLGLCGVAARSGAPFDSLDLSIVAGSTVFFAALAAVWLFGHPLAVLMQHLLSRRSARLAQVIDDTSEALRHYARDGRSVAIALALSIIVIVLAILPIIAIAEAMPFAGLSALNYGVAALYALLANSLPVTPGGLGVGETAFATLCTMLAPQAPPADYGTIFLAFRCVFIIATIPGLVIYLIDP